MGDKRHTAPGFPPLLNDIQQAQLWQVLPEPPTDGDFWDGLKVTYERTDKSRGEFFDTEWIEEKSTVNA